LQGKAINMDFAFRVAANEHTALEYGEDPEYGPFK
jgi:hypothetical protein